MPNEITITPAEVRGIIGTEVTSSILPDSIINLKAYKDAAIREVKESVPDFAGRSGDDVQRLNTAADLICAALLVVAFPSVLSIKNESGPGFTFERVDPNVRAAELRARADRELAAVLNESVEELISSAMPTMFTLASGSRGL